MGSAGPHSTAEAGEENDEFSGGKELIGDGAQSSHSLFSERRQSSATDAVEGMPKTEHMDLFSRLETGIVSINEHQMGASEALLMGLMRPGTSNATHSRNEDVRGVHGGYDVRHLNELWCADSVDVAQVSAAGIPCPGVIWFES